ncbi:sulfoxide reductase heme-binding subunit YedZ [Candidatus Gracilibacteria bacterium]|nr:sulfoxide reductase heme-binding subunit YedZ [Candidatus Gracilibacteria bacterium]
MRRFLAPLIHIAGLAPLLVLWYYWFFANLVNPIQTLTQFSGKTGLVLLSFCLACTPLNTLLGWKWAIGLRKPLGLYAFFYAALHLLIFVVLDYGLDLALIQEAVLEKRYVLAGFAAFLLLTPLALTSTRAAMRRLGRNWKRLHWLIYPAGMLAVLHYLWLSKDPRQALIFGAILATLLILRLPPLRRSIVRLRSRLSPNGSTRLIRAQPAATLTHFGPLALAEPCA